MGRRIQARRAARRGDVATSEIAPQRQRILGPGGMIRGLFTGAMDNQKTKAMERTEQDGKFRYDHRDYETRIPRQRGLGQPTRQRNFRDEDRGYQRNDQRDFDRYSESDYVGQSYQREGQRDFGRFESDKEEPPKYQLIDENSYRRPQSAAEWVDEQRNFSNERSYQRDDQRQLGPFQTDDREREVRYGRGYQRDGRREFNSA